MTDVETDFGPTPDPRPVPDPAVGPESSPEPSPAAIEPEVDPAAAAAAVAAWLELTDPAHAAWLTDVADTVAAGGPTPTEVGRWRRTIPASRVGLAIDLSRARRSLVGRTDSAASMLADPAGAAMATDAAVAAAKAGRMASTQPREIWDLACGIGGDAMELARIPGLERLVLVDHDSARLAMARHNVALVAPDLEVVTHAGDAVALAPPAASGRIVHVDPARRDEAGQRAWGLDGLQPDAAALALIIERSQNVALKLGPGIDAEAVPHADQARMEYVARGRTLVQAIAWYGELADRCGPRRATIVPGGHSLAGVPDTSMNAAILGQPMGGGRTAVDDPPAFLLIPHPALERARLVSAAIRDAGIAPETLRPLAGGLGVIASERDPESPWFEAIAVHATMPWRERRVKQRLAALGTGEVIVRTRGGAVKVDVVARRLRGRTGPRRTVAIYRLGKELVTFIGEAAN